MLLLHENYSTGESIYATHWYSEYMFIKQKEGNLSFQEYIQRVYKVTSVEELEELTVEDPVFFDMNLKYSDCRSNLVNDIILNYENLSREYWILKRGQYIKRLCAYLIKRVNAYKSSANKRINKIKHYF